MLLAYKQRDFILLFEENPYVLPALFVFHNEADAKFVSDLLISCATSRSVSSYEVSRDFFEFLLYLAKLDWKARRKVMKGFAMGFEHDICKGIEECNLAQKLDEVI